jgi:hypothetical protein
MMPVAIVNKMTEKLDKLPDFQTEPFEYPMALNHLNSGLVG